MVETIHDGKRTEERQILFPANERLRVNAL